jgi:IS605 OrfB family transposase
LTVSKYRQLEELALRLGILRSEVWNEYGSLKGVGVRDREIRDTWLLSGKKFNVSARLWKETLRDVINSISAYQSSAKIKVRKEIFRKTKHEAERKELYSLLRRDKWKETPFLRRQMRKNFKHGHTKVRNQIVLDLGCYKSFMLKGRAWLAVVGLTPRKRIAIPLSTNRIPSGTLRLILKDGQVEIHHLVEVEGNCVTRPCGTKTLGVDKGYTEAFTDSDGDRHGPNLGEVLSSESDWLKIKYQRRNQLRAIAEAKPHKSEKIRKNNLGRKKLNARQKVHTDHVRDIAFKSVHSILDKANIVVTEDLTSPIKSKRRQTKDTKRRLAGWVKGSLANALHYASQRRSASLVLVNAAYTSQMDSVDGTLSGYREGDQFYRANGDVLDADQNAARNILARRTDHEIGLWTPYQTVRAILLRRTEQRLGLLNQDSSCIPI